MGVTSLNDKRRKEIKRAAAILNVVIVDVERIHGEEEEAYNNTPDSLQETDRYTESGDAVDILSTAMAELESVKDSLEELAGV